jgi:ketosteroid isomerase-like protein
MTPNHAANLAIATMEQRLQFPRNLLIEADMVHTRLSYAVPSLLVMLACSPKAGTTTNTSPEADKAAVEKAHDVLEGAYRKSDCDAMVSQAASDASMEPPNTATAKGPDGIRAWCQPMFTQMKTKELNVANKNIDVSGDLAVDTGDYDWTLTAAGGGDQRIQGRYVTIWHRQTDGSWKMSRLIWNSSQPAPVMNQPAPPAKMKS